MLRLFWSSLVAAAVADPPEDSFAETEDNLEFENDALTSDQMAAMHAKLDLNGDGRASFEEVMQFTAIMRREIAQRDVLTIMDEMDINKDGKLGLDELLRDLEEWGAADEDDEREMQLRRQLESAKFHASDNDKDGFLDINEISSLFYPETKDEVLHLSTRATLDMKDRDKDGELTPKEFWEGDALDGEEIPISDAEHEDFRRLDKDSNGRLTLEELKLWESGQYHTQQAMLQLFEVADKDNDVHLTAKELDKARVKIAGQDAQYHMQEWAEHFEL